MTLLTEDDYNRLVPYYDIIKMKHDIGMLSSNAGTSIMADIWTKRTGELVNTHCGDCTAKLYENMYIHINHYKEVNHGS